MGERTPDNEELADSIYRVFRGIVGQSVFTPEDSTEKASLEILMRWQTLATVAVQNFDAMVGKSVQDVGEQFYKWWHKLDIPPIPYQELPLLARIGWQTVVKHIAYTLAEGESPVKSEQFFIDNGLEKVKKEGANA